MSTNCLITVANFGHLHVRATRVVHGMSVVAYASEGQSRTSKAFYSSKRTSGSFELRLIFSKNHTYRVVCDWLERYSRWAADPATDASPVRVVIPVRNFDKTGILKSGVTFGDDVTDVTKSVDLAFVGSRDPYELDSPVLSQFALGERTDDPALPYFYPAARQLSGRSTGWDTLYDRHGGNTDAAEQAFLRERMRG